MLNRNPSMSIKFNPPFFSMVDQSEVDCVLEVPKCGFC